MQIKIADARHTINEQRNEQLKKQITNS